MRFNPFFFFSILKGKNRSEERRSFNDQFLYKRDDATRAIRLVMTDLFLLFLINLKEKYGRY